jgi:amino acid transporter
LLEPEPLKRELSALAIAVLAINGIVGAGIFGLPADAARLTGAFSPLVFVVCGLAMSSVMISFAQAASYFRGTGGPILYAQTAFGSFAGFQIGWILYVGRVTSLAANGNLLATYLGEYVDGADEGVGRVAVLGVLTAAFAAINVIGVKQSVGALMAITVLKFLPLLVFVLVGSTFLGLAPFAHAPLPAYEDFGEAVLLVLYAFIGFEGALIPAGETRDPKRDMPRAMILTACIVTVLYVLIQSISVAVTPDLASSKVPLADAARVMMGAAGAAMISIGALISILGNYASSVLTAPRMTYALARDGSLPAWFGRVHERHRTPHVSIVCYCALGFALGATGTFAGLAVMSLLARLIGYGATVAALPRLRKIFPNEPGALRLPGGMTIPAIAFVVCAWLVAQVKLEAVWKTGALIAAGAVLFALTRRSAPQ